MGIGGSQAYIMIVSVPPALLPVLAAPARPRAGAVSLADLFMLRGNDTEGV